MQNYNERLEKIKKILRVKLIESLGNDRDEEAATFFQTSVSTFRRWKNGSQKPDTETLTLIAEKLGISLDWFLLGKGDSGLNVEISAPSQKIDTSIIRELEKKIMKLEDEKTVQNKRINGLEYTIELQKRLLDPQEKGPQTLTASGDVAPPVPTSLSAK